MVFTDADTGEIYVATNLGTNTEDSGWGGSGTVGMTTRLADDPDEGYSGMPVIAAIGNKVMVAWIAGRRVARSRQSCHPTTGRPGRIEVTLSTAQVWDLAAAGDGTRMALTWANSTAIKLKVYTSSGWQTTRTVTTFSSAATYKVGYGPAVALTGNTRVGVAWSACTRSDCSGGSTKGVNLRWRESSDNGASWKSTVTLATYTASSSKRFNDYPSVVMTSTPRRYVLYNTASSSILDLQDGHRGRQRDALTSSSAAPAGVRLDAGRAVRSRPMLERMREMPGGIRLFLLYAFGILFLIGSALRFIVDQAITAPVSLPGLVAMVLLAYTIFTTTLVIQRKQAARRLALGLASLTIPLVPLLAVSGLAIEAVFIAALAILLFRGLLQPEVRTYLREV